MFQVIFGNHLLLAIVILIILFMVPALILHRRGVRDVQGSDRRKKTRHGIDRRA